MNLGFFSVVGFQVLCCRFSVFGCGFSLIIADFEKRINFNQNGQGYLGKDDFLISHLSSLFSVVGFFVVDSDV
jgi:hypothetical protein